MKKVILTVSALLVSAAMVFAFAGCTDNKTDDGESNPVGNYSEEDSANTPVADVAEADTNA